MNKLDTHCIVRLPSGEQRLIAMSCHAAVGAVSNPQSKNRVIGKAGYNRHRGIRPTVRRHSLGLCFDFDPVFELNGGLVAWLCTVRVWCLQLAWALQSRPARVPSAFLR